MAVTGRHVRPQLPADMETTKERPVPFAGNPNGSVTPLPGPDRSCSRCEHLDDKVVAATQTTVAQTDAMNIPPWAWVIIGVLTVLVLRG